MLEAAQSKARQAHAARAATSSSSAEVDGVAPAAHPRLLWPAAEEEVALLLSGGVDSAVAAWLLKEQGYEISGAYIRTWMNEEMPLADCPAQQDIEDSRAVATHLGIDYEIVNLFREFRIEDLWLPYYCITTDLTQNCQRVHRNGNGKGKGQG